MDSRDLSQFLAALNQAGVLKKPGYKFTSHELCFNKRFEALDQIQQPPPLTYDDFMQGTDFSGVSSTTLLSSSTECFTASRSLLEKINMHCEKMEEDYRCISKQDATKLIKVCIGNSIFLLKLSQGVASGDTSSGKVTFDFQSHNEFCTINVKL